MSAWGRLLSLAPDRFRPKAALRDDRLVAKADGLNHISYLSRNYIIIGLVNGTIRERLPLTTDSHCPDDIGHANAV